jgi:hypothetical protein
VIHKKPNRSNFVFLISRVQGFESSKFLCLSPIIRGVLWGVDTNILNIRLWVVLRSLATCSNQLSSGFDIQDWLWLILLVTWWCLYRYEYIVWYLCICIGIGIGQIISLSNSHSLLIHHPSSFNLYDSPPSITLRPPPSILHPSPFILHSYKRNRCLTLKKPFLLLLFFIPTVCGRQFIASKIGSDCVRKPDPVWI